MEAQWGKEQGPTAHTSVHSLKNASSSIIRSHQLIVLDTTRELLLPQRRRMCPRLQPVLLPNCGRKAARPLLSRIVLHYVLNCRLVHELGVATHVVCPSLSVSPALRLQHTAYDSPNTVASCINNPTLDIFPLSPRS